MAITIDGEKEGHPTNKADYAKRLTRLVMHDVHGESDGKPTTGLLFRNARRDGNAMEISFDNASGLRATSGEPMRFAIAGVDKKFVWAKAKIMGEKVIVSIDQVPEPTAVRYAWAVKPNCNLANDASRPASPFRTDDWNDTPSKK